MNQIALIITALGGILASVGGLFLSNRAQKRSEKVQNAATLLEGYDEMVQNQARTIESLTARLLERDKQLDNSRSEASTCQQELTTVKIQLLGIKKDNLPPIE